jgi:pimeloyl-ACP methyl ester carboxylesterase
VSGSSDPARRAHPSAGEPSYGDVGEGPVVVLLHGLGATSDLWRDVTPVLAQRMRVVAPDLSGFRDAEDPDACAGRIRELLHELDIEECAVVGHGLGGVVAQVLALRGGVDCLVLIDTGPVDPSGTKEPVAEAAPEAAALGTLDIPALVLWGEDDPYVGVDVAEALADALPSSTLVLLPGCSHFLPEEAPDTVASLIAEFLRIRFLGIPHHHQHAGSAGPVPIELRRAHGPA